MNKKKGNKIFFEIDKNLLKIEIKAFLN